MDSRRGRGARKRRSWHEARKRSWHEARIRRSLAGGYSKESEQPPKDLGEETTFGVAEDEGGGRGERGGAAGDDGAEQSEDETVRLGSSEGVGDRSSALARHARGADVEDQERETHLDVRGEDS